MAEIRLPIVANLNLDEQLVVNLGAQTPGPDGVDNAARRDYVDTSAIPTATVGGNAVPPTITASGSTSLTGEIDANYLRILNPQYDPSYAPGGTNADPTDRRALEHYFVPVAGALDTLSDVLINTPAAGQFLRFEMVDIGSGTMALRWTNAAASIGDLDDVADAIGATGAILEVSGTGDDRQLTYVSLAAALEDAATGAGIQDLNNVPALPTGTTGSDAYALVYDRNGGTFSWVRSGTTDPTHSFLNGDGAFTEPQFNELSGIAASAQGNRSGREVLAKDASGEVQAVNPSIVIQEETAGASFTVDQIQFVGASVEVTQGSAGDIGVVTVRGGGGGTSAVDYLFAGRNGTPAPSTSEDGVLTVPLEFDEGSAGQRTWTYRITAPTGYYIPKKDDTAFAPATDDVDDFVGGNNATIRVTQPGQTTFETVNYNWNFVDNADTTDGVSTLATSSLTIATTANTTVVTGFDVTFASPENFAGRAVSPFQLGVTLRPIADAQTDNADDVESNALSFTPEIYQEFIFARSAANQTAYTITADIADTAFNLINRLTSPLVDGHSFSVSPTTDGTTEYLNLWVPNSFAATADTIIFAGGFQVTPGTGNIIPGTTPEVNNAPFGGAAGANGIKVGYTQFVLPFRHRTSIELRS